MSTTDKGARDAVVPDLKHLVVSSGGARAILGGAGAIVAIDQAGIKGFQSMGGISGGSVPSLVYAYDGNAKNMLQSTIDIDFSSTLTRRGSILHVLLAYFMQGRLEKIRPRKGVLTSEKLGILMDSKVPTWPKGYWTMAVVGENQILFTDHGVFEITPDGQVTVLSDKPAPVGVAIRATCAVPGIIAAMPYKGRYLFDGALSHMGSCPAAIPQIHFQANRNEIIACEVGGENTRSSARLLKLWSIVCGGNCVPNKDSRELTSDDVAILVKPELNHFRSLEFTLTRDQKWQATMSGYIGCVKELKAKGVLVAEKLREMESICHAFKRIERMCMFAGEGELSKLTEELLSRHGLY